MEVVDFFGLTGYVGLFIVCFVAATLIPFSSEAVVVAVIAAGYAPSLVFIIALVGNYLGALVNFFIGKKGIVYLAARMKAKDQHRLERAQVLYGRWGAPILLLSWVPIVGDPLTLAAGALEVRFSTFSFWVILGKALRYGVVIWLALRAIT